MRGAAPAASSADVERATARAVAFFEGQRLGERRARDGLLVGIQAELATAPGQALDLYAIADGDAAALGHPLAVMVRKKLGFTLEAELFSNMLFTATLGASGLESVRALAPPLLATFRDSDADGLYHFFASLAFACDLDCTGVAGRARLVTGDLEPGTPAGAAALRRITQRVLRSAAVEDVSSLENQSYGKANGPLERLVFKVYPDDHDVQGPECDRGLKNNPVVVANALYPVLLELSLGLRAPDELVALKEYVEGEAEPRTGSASVAEIVAANVAYALRHLASFAFLQGCRYYASPDAFLCFFSESVRAYPALFEPLRTRRWLAHALAARRRVQSAEVPFDPHTSLNTAFRAVAADNAGLPGDDERARLLAQQGADGAWSDFDSLYTFGTSAQVHFRSRLVTTAFALRALAPAPLVTPGDAGWARPILERVPRL
jgi:hypothetical protein